jgi:hypothetical protein
MYREKSETTTDSLEREFEAGTGSTYPMATYKSRIYRHVFRWKFFDMSSTS